MVAVNQSVIVPYTPAEMFDLVDNVEEYHEFLPWCHNSHVHNRNEHEVKATLKVGMEGMNKSFTTANKRFPRERIEMHLVSGPFRQLQGTWLFLPKGEDHCEIKLDLEFEFSNRLLAMAFGKFFNTALSTMIDAFKKRAAEVYGHRKLVID